MSWVFSVCSERERITLVWKSSINGYCQAQKSFIRWRKISFALPEFRFLPKNYSRQFPTRLSWRKKSNLTAIELHRKSNLTAIELQRTLTTYFLCRCFSFSIFTKLLLMPVLAILLYLWLIFGMIQRLWKLHKITSFVEEFLTYFSLTFTMPRFIIWLSSHSVF